MFWIIDTKNGRNMPVIKKAKDIRLEQIERAADFYLPIPLIEDAPLSRTFFLNSSIDMMGVIRLFYWRSISDDLDLWDQQLRVRDRDRRCGEFLISSEKSKCKAKCFRLPRSTNRTQQKYNSILINVQVKSMNNGERALNRDLVSIDHFRYWVS